MPCKVNWEQRGVHKEFSGAVTADEFVRSTEVVQADPRFDSLRYIIVDYRDVTAYEIDNDAVDLVTAWRIGSYSSNPKIRLAFIAVDERLADAIKQAIEHDSLPFSSKFFSTIDQAREWAQQTVQWLE